MDNEYQAQVYDIQYNGQKNRSKQLEKFPKGCEINQNWKDRICQANGDWETMRRPHSEAWEAIAPETEKDLEMQTAR